jgi:hypothetical protein
MSPFEWKQYRPGNGVAMAGALFGVAGMQVPKGPSHSLTAGLRLKGISTRAADFPFDDKVEGGRVGDTRADRHAA